MHPFSLAIGVGRHVTCLGQERLSPATLEQWQTCDGIRRFAYAWADAHQISKVKVQVNNAKVWLQCDCDGHRKCKKAAGEVYRGYLNS